MPGTEKALGACKAMVQDKQPVRMLLICGGTGNGKTFLCDAVVIALYKKDIRTNVTLWPELIRTLKRKMHRRQPSETSYDDYFESIRKKSHLILDDVGMGTGGTFYEFGELEDIVSYRYREQLFTIITTNMDIKDLPERVVSRFSDPRIARVVENAGKDYRRSTLWNAQQASKQPIAKPVTSEKKGYATGPTSRE